MYLNNVCVIGAGFDLDPALHIQPSIGLFHSVCHCPGNLLDSGFHRVGLLLMRGNRVATYRLDEAIGFEIVDAGERKYAWFGWEPGVVQPTLAWRTSLAMIP